MPLAVVSSAGSQGPSLRSDGRPCRHYAAPLAAHPAELARAPFAGMQVRVLVDITSRHQAARAAVSDEVVDAFMAARPLDRMFG